MQYYLDNNASEPISPAARAAIVAALDGGGNPSSPHQHGRALRQGVEAARQQTRHALNAAQATVVFTASGSEANNICFNLWPHMMPVVSAIEHPSVINPAMAKEAQIIAVDAKGLVELNRLEDILRPATSPALVSLMLANNETGVIQPVAAAAQLAHRYGALIHCDASQAQGRMGVDFTALGVDLMTISGHKIGAGLGAAALIIAEHVMQGAMGRELVPMMRGGNQETGLRPATENFVALAGLTAAMHDLPRRHALMPEIAVWRDEIAALARRLNPRAVVVGEAAPRLANTLCLSLPPTPAAVTIMACDLAGIAISAGAACSSGSIGKSKILQAMGLADAIIASSVRISLGVNNLPPDPADFPAARARLLAKLEGVWGR